MPNYKPWGYPSNSNCQVTKSADQSIPDITLTSVTWNQENFDTDDMHDNVTNNNRITVKTSGTYLILCNVKWQSNSVNSRRCHIYKNGAQHSGVYNNAVSNSYQNMLAIDDSSVNDYFELQVYQDSGAAKNLFADQSSFTLMRIA